MRALPQLVLAFVPLMLMSAGAGSEPAAPAAAISGMGWLAGAWEGPMWGGTFSTYYCTPDGGKIMSYSRLLKGGAVSFHEFEVFEVDGDGVIFRPFPGGKPATPLRLMACDKDARKATFENPDKDFPTRIVYHRAADDRLVITLSDPHHSSDKVEVFDLKRQAAKSGQ
jgi:hypothetical protein